MAFTLQLATLPPYSVFSLLYRCIGLSNTFTGALYSLADKSQISNSPPRVTAAIWDATGDALATLEGHTAPVWGVGWSNDSTQVVSVSGSLSGQNLASHEMRLWNSEDGSLTLSSNQYAAPLVSVASSPAASQIAAVTLGGELLIWDLSASE